MGRLRAVQSKVKPLAPRLRAPTTASEQRITGRRLQDRRLRIWSKDPHCVDCGRLTAYPAGFELDHEVALVNGGTDTDDNCKVRCCGPGSCHEAKTQRDMQR